MPSSDCFPRCYHGNLANYRYNFDWCTQVCLATIHHICSWKVFVSSQQTQKIDPMLFQCWSTVYDAGPTLKQHWIKFCVCLMLSWRTPWCFSHWSIHIDQLSACSLTSHLSLMRCILFFRLIIKVCLAKKSNINQEWHKMPEIFPFHYHV